MPFIQHNIGNTVLFSSILFIFCLSNLPRSVHIIRRVCSRLAWVSNKSRLACYWFDGAFIVCGLLFIASSLCFEVSAPNQPTHCLLWLCLNILLYLTSGIMLLFFLRHRLLIFVSSAGTWIQLPRYFHLYPILILFAGFTYLLSLVLFAVLSDTNPAAEEPPQCDYRNNEHFLLLFLPSTAILSLLYCFDLYTFSSILLQCRSMVVSLRSSVVSTQSPNILKQHTFDGQRRKTNKMVCRLIRPAVLVTVFNVSTTVAMLVADVHCWQFIADLNFLFISLCITFMYRNPLSHFKAIATCNTYPRMLAIASPSRSPVRRQSVLNRAKTLTISSSILPMANDVATPTKLKITSKPKFMRSKTATSLSSTPQCTPTRGAPQNELEM